ncbi:MAG: VCBS repeat-containing protein [Deltaproteobacteria bacterium]|nr:VCBS repeat-containing protein [Deltaproteobacteria bacterium]
MKFKLILILCLFSLLAFPFYSVAQPKDPGKVYKVAILPFIIHSQENLDYLREGINDILTSRITVEGKIIVVERTLVERILWEMRPIRLDEAVAKQVGTRAGADYVVLGSITKIGNYISLDARLIPITEDKPPLGAYTQHKGIDDVMTKIGDFAQDIGFRIIGRRATAARPSDTRHSSIIQPGRDIGRVGPEGLGFKKSQTFDFEIKGLDIGDVDGDKKNEVVVMDHHNIYVFKYDGDKLSLFRKIEAGYQHNFLTLDVADVNRNGFAEIIVTSVIEDNLQSFILEYEQGEFRTITRKAGWFFRTLEHPKDGSILIGQQMGSDGLISGSIFKFAWKKNSFEKGPKMPFPKETKIFGLAIGEVRKSGITDILQLDDAGKLRVLSSDGMFVWKGRGDFGGTNNFYETFKKQDDVYRAGSAPAWRVYLPGKIVVKDLDRDGLNEVIINKNQSSGLGVFEKARSFGNGEIHNLVWEQESLVSNWKTRELEGYIADYQVKDADNDGNDELVAALVESHASGAIGGKGTSQILFFKLF